MKKGKTRRAIRTRNDEHLAHIEYIRSEKSIVVYHILNSGHSVNNSSLKSVRHVTEAFNNFPIVYTVYYNDQ